jgi:hypothetical protein
VELGPVVQHRAYKYVGRGHIGAEVVGTELVADAGEWVAHRGKSGGSLVKKDAAAMRAPRYSALNRVQKVELFGTHQKSQ